MSHLSTTERWPSYTSEESNSGRKTYAPISPWQLFTIKRLFEAAWLEMLEARAMEMVSQIRAHMRWSKGAFSTDWLVPISTVYHLCGVLFMTFWETNPKRLHQKWYVFRRGLK